MVDITALRLQPGQMIAFLAIFDVDPENPVVYYCSDVDVAMRRHRTLARLRTRELRVTVLQDPRFAFPDSP